MHPTLLQAIEGTLRNAEQEKKIGAPGRELSLVITKLEEALMWEKRRGEIA